MRPAAGVMDVSGRSDAVANASLQQSQGLLVVSDLMLGQT